MHPVLATLEEDAVAAHSPELCRRSLRKMAKVFAKSADPDQTF